MAYTQVIEDGKAVDKHIPDQCGECGKFLTKSGDCNHCGMSMCKGCGEMLDHGEPCEYCQPKEYLESLKEEITECQHDNEVKSCDECPDKDRYCYDGQKKDIKERIKESEDK